MRFKEIKYSFGIFLLGLIFPLLHSDAIASEVEKVDVFVAGEGGYHGFRIPSLLRTDSGTLLAFCEARKNDLKDHGNIDLVLKRSTDEGKTWGPIELVYEEGGDENVTIGNPCPVICDGMIFLHFCRDNNEVLFVTSSDNGKSWNTIGDEILDPTNHTGRVKKKGWGWYATGPGVGIQIKNGPKKGRLVIPCDHREKIDGKWVMRSHVFYSDDYGCGWKLGGSADIHTDECQVVELSDGRLMLNMRSYWGKTAKVKEKAGMRAVAYSDDGGETWSELSFDKNLIEPVCQASLIRYDSPDHDKPVLIFSNPASKTRRHRLTVKVSLDEGQSWPHSLMLHEGPSAYSCLTVVKEGVIGCLYECGQKNAYEKLTFARINEDDLLN